MCALAVLARFTPCAELTQAVLLLKPGRSCSAHAPLQKLRAAITNAAAAAAAAASADGNSSSPEDSNALDWASMRSAQRAGAMADAAAAAYRNSTAASSSGQQSASAAVAALTQLWQFQSRPDLLEQDCGPQKVTAFAVLFGLGLACRLLVLLLVRWKVARKAQE
jgi:hypothetical protein